MSEDVPAVYPSASELWQYAQAITTISALAARIRARLARARESGGQLAFAEAENAARQHEARQHPPVRLMTEQERAAWQDRVPAGLAGQQHDEPFTVWTAQLTDHTGTPTGEWGIQAHTWADGAVTSSLFAVCRDAEDALALTRQMREHGSQQHLAELHTLAASTGHATATPQPGPGPSATPHGRTPVVLTEAAWAAALRKELAPPVAEAIIVTDPAHAHHPAWRELWELANEEVRRIGADPAALASLVRTVPRWREGIRNPPALAHWALTQARSTTSYTTTVTAQPPPGHQPTGQRPATPAAPQQPPRPPRLATVHSPEQALAWATGLDPHNPQHRIEAKLGFSRWGTTVDTTLARTYPRLVEQTNTAAGARPTPTDQTGRPHVDPPVAAELAGEVHRLDPAKPIDRRAAHVMLGRVPPQIDRLLAEKFGTDPQFAEKLHTLYPHGLPEADAATWRRQAEDHDRQAAARAATPDDQRTPQREDVHDRATASRERGLAAQQHGIAAAATNQQPAVLRRTEPLPTRPQRRT